ncbi:hypothetical protein Tco_0595358 [Tanacetum coccineum]
MADHLRSMEELLRIPIVGIENAIVVLAVLADEFELKPELLDFIISSSVGSSTQIDAITALTKQVEALISSMQEAYNRNQEALIQLMQTQMGQMEETFQERLSCVPPSDIETYPREEHKAVTTMSGLTLDGSFIPHSNFLFYQEKEQESETITEMVEIASSQSTPHVIPPETPPLSTPKLKEDPKPNPHHPSIPYPSRLQEEKFQALENLTGRADHFVYRIDIVDSLCNKFSIKNNSLSGNPTPSSDFVVESLSPLHIPYEDSDSLVEETDILLSHFDDSPPECTTTHSDYSLPGYDSFIFDLSIDPFPPADRRDFTRVLEENIFDLSTKGLTINVLNDSSLLLSDCDSSLSEEFSEIDLLVLFPSRNEDIIFDPGIFIIKRVQYKRFHIFALDDFSNISFIGNSLLLIDPSMIETFLSFPSINEDKDALRS